MFPLVGVIHFGWGFVYVILHFPVIVFFMLPELGQVCVLDESVPPFETVWSSWSNGVSRYRSVLPGGCAAGDRFVCTS